MKVHHGRRPPRGRTVLGEFARRARDLADAHVARTWPSSVYALDLPGFARNVLGVDLWSAQIEMLDAIRDHKRVAVAGGRKVSKDHTAACAAIWFYSTFPDARVIITATRAEQIETVLWREIRKLVLGSGLCLDCRRADPGMRRPCPHSSIVAGKLGDSSKSGLRANDGREIRGTTATEAERMAGISGANLLYILDEASGIDDAIFDAIKGNVAGGGECRILAISNPSRSSGWFFDAFHSKRDLWHTLQISSETTPNVLAGEMIFPGVATRDFIDGARRDWGPESPMYLVHVLGIHAELVKGRIFSVAAIIDAEARWADASTDGRLHLGLDPAGASGLGDESAFAVRRGKKILRLHTRRGLTDEGHVAEVLGLLRIERLENEPDVPIVVVDRDGPVGDRTFRALLAHAQTSKDFVVFGHRGANAPKKELLYGTARDELYASFETWVREGGAIPTDAKLEGELGEFRFDEDVRNRLRLTSKDDLRSALGRSPDRADACALACLEIVGWRPSAQQLPPSPAQAPRLNPYTTERKFDPYAGFAYRGGSR